MFGTLFGKKNATTQNPDHRVSPAGGWLAREPVPADSYGSVSTSTPTPTLNSLAYANRDSDGLSIEDYALHHRLSSEEVWNKLRRGHLVGRTSRGKVLVYESISAAALAVPGSPQSRSSASADGDLPPLEFGATPQRYSAPTPSNSAGSLVTMDSVSGPQSTELALLLDHLSLAKEENREILRLTQDTLTKLSAMTDAVVQMKDEVIKSKDLQLATMQQAIAEKERNLSQLRQDKEDLEMLNRTLGTALGNAAGPT